MNEYDPSFERDPELRGLDERLRQALPVAAPPDLANRIYRATVADLPEKPVVARLGWSSLSGWKYAAAVGLVFFYAAAWLKPMTLSAPVDTQAIMIAEKVIAEPDSRWDQQMDELSVEVAEISTEWEQPVFDPTTDQSDSLAADLYQLELMLAGDRAG